MGLLEDIHKNGNTIILVTHEEDIAAHAHRIVRLKDGKVESDNQNTAITTYKASNRGRKYSLDSLQAFLV